MEMPKCAVAEVSHCGSRMTTRNAMSLHPLWRPSCTDLSISPIRQSSLLGKPAMEWFLDDTLATNAKGGIIRQSFARTNVLVSVQRGSMITVWQGTEGRCREAKCGRYGEQGGASFSGAP